MKTFEMKFDALNHLNAGDIWSTKRRGCFVVLQTKPAIWRGDDRDVYSHINQWMTCRNATAMEEQTWERAVSAQKAQKSMRKSVAASKSFEYRDGSLYPSHASRMTLDSYDSRWEAPAVIKLTDDQSAIEMEYIQACRALNIG